MATFSERRARGETNTLAEQPLEVTGPIEQSAQDASVNVPQMPESPEPTEQPEQEITQQPIEQPTGEDGQLISVAEQVEQRRPQTAGDAIRENMQRRDRTPTSDVSAVIKSERDTRRAAMRKNIEHGHGGDSGRASRILSVSEETGLPVSFLQRHLDDIEPVLEAEKFDVDKFIEESPVMADWIAEDPSHYVLAKDDISRMGAIEHAFRTPMVGLEAGRAQVEVAKLYSDAAKGYKFTDDDKERIKELDRVIARSQSFARGEFGQLVIENSMQLPQLYGPIFKGAERAIPGMLVGGGGGAALGLLGGPGAPVSVPAGMAIGAKTVGSAAFTYGVVEFNQEQYTGMLYRELLDLKDENGEGMDEGVARVASQSAGALAGSMGVIPIGTLLRSFPGLERALSTAGTTQTVQQALRSPQVRSEFTQLASSYGKVLTAEVATEMAQRGISIIGREIAKQVDEGEFEATTLREATGEIAEEGVMAARSMIFLSAAGPASNFAVNTYKTHQDANSAKLRKQFFESLGDETQQSEFVKNNPGEFAKLMERMTKDGPLENLYIDTERFNELFQSRNLDPEQVARELYGDDGQAYQNAVESGTMQVPTARYAQVLAGSDYNAELSNHLRTDPDEMSFSESQQFMNDLSEIRSEIGEGQTNTPLNQIYNDIYGQLQQTRPRDIADNEARMMASMYYQAAERSGQDAMEFYNSRPVRIRSEGLSGARQNLTETDLFINRLRDGDTPQQSDIYGQSVTEWLRSEGIQRESEGGELTARDVDVGQVGRNQMLRESGRFASLDDAAEAAVEQGYISQRDVDQFLNVIDRDLSGQPVYSDRNLNQQLQDIAEGINQVTNYLERLGVTDLSQLTNEEIVSILDGTRDPDEVLGDGATELMQDSGIDLDAARQFFQSAINPEMVAANSDQPIYNPGQEIQQTYPEQQQGNIVKGELFQRDADRDDSAAAQAQADENLLVVHNVTPAGIRFINELGGMAAPSLAVSRVDTGGFTSFGDISLIADPSILNDRKAKAFDADVYTPRQPRAEFIINEKAWNKLAEQINEDAREAGGLTVPDYYDLERGARELTFNHSIQYSFLKSIGRAPKPVKKKVDRHVSAGARMNLDRWNLEESPDYQKFRNMVQKRYEDIASSREESARMTDALRNIYFDENGQVQPDMLRKEFDKAVDYRESGGIDRYATQEKIRKRIDQGKNKEGLEQYASNLLNQVSRGARFVSGQDQYGGNRYSPYTMKAIVRNMTQKIRNGENFNYGGGNIRAAYATEFRSIADIQNSRDRIVSNEDFQALKNESNERVSQTISELAPFYKYDANNFGYTNEAAEIISDGEREWWNNFERTEESETLIRNLVDYLVSMPTEYFEVKMQREVALSEFKAAVVPSGTSAEVVNLLKDSGLRVHKYRGDNRAAEVKKVAKRYKTLFQEGRTQKARGSLQFGDTGEFILNLFENQNLSTVIHESGHLFLEIMGDVVQSGRASEQQQVDYQALLDWMGAKDRASITVEQHEKLARGFEAYTREGKAPSQALSRAFSRFWSWMVNIYKNVRQLDVELTDEVREVFDRALASDDEIQLAREGVQDNQLFSSAEEMGVSQSEFDQYVQAVDDTRREQREQMAREMMGDLNRQQKKWWKNEESKLRDQVLREVNDMPVYKALSAMQRGKMPDGTDLPDGYPRMKMNKQSILDEYGQRALNSLPRPYVYTVQGGVSVDMAAQHFGFESGQEMITAMVNAPRLNDYITQEVKDRMTERYGDMMLDNTASEKAADAVHSSKRGELLARELRALAKRTGKRSTPVQVMREHAERQIAQTASKDTKPYIYQRAEAKASIAAIEAAARGDYDTALTERQRQLYNHELYRAARDANETAEKVRAHLAKYESNTARGRIGKAGADYLAQIDGIMERFEFRRVPIKKIEKRKALAEWIREKEQLGETMGEEIYVPQDLLDESQTTNYRELSNLELSGLYDTVRQIEHYARLKNRLLATKQKRDFQETIDNLVDNVRSTQKQRKMPPFSRSAMSAREKMGSLAKQVDASMLKVEQVIEWLDGTPVGGAWHEALWQPAVESQNLDMDLSQKFTQRVIELTQNIPKHVRKRMMETVDFGTDRRMVRRDLMMVALNTGNESNYKKMLHGMKWEEGQVKNMLNELTREEWDFVQGVWDSLEELWPYISELEKDMKGIPPERVEARSFTNEHGTFRGGYFPMMYDPTETETGERQLASSLNQLLGENYTRATTPTGHTKERVDNYAAPVQLDFEMLPMQIAGVIKDISHRRFLMDANRIINNTQVRKAMNETMGPEYHGMLRDWLKNVANDRNANNMATMGWFKKGAEALRLNFMVASMGIKATTLVSQYAGLGPAVEVVGLKHMRRGYTEFLQNPKAVHQFVTGKSGEMRHRLMTKDRDLRNNLRRLAGKTGIWADSQRFAMQSIGYVDLTVTIPTWMGEFRKSIATGMSEDLAVHAADRAVRMSQGAAGAKDIAAVASKDSIIMRSLTMFFTPFSAMHNRMRDVGHTFGGIKDVPQAAMRTFWLILVPGVLGEIMVGRGPDEDEDDLEWALKASVMYATLGMPFFRDIVSGAVGDYGYSISPLAQSVERVPNTWNTGVRVWEGEEDMERLAREVFTTSGFLFGLPVSQINITGDYLYDIYTGDEEPESMAEFMRDIMYVRSN